MAYNFIRASKAARKDKLKGNKYIAVILFIGLATIFAEGDEFNITVTCSYISLEVEDIFGEPYAGWNPDTLDTSTEIVMLDAEGAYLVNSGNVPLTVHCSVQDMPDGYTSGYISWDAVESPDSIDQYSVALYNTASPVCDTLSPEWVTLNEDPLLVFPSMFEGTGRYLYFSLTTPPFTSDRQDHRIGILIEGSLP